jgi:hypothetical protein
MNISLRLVSLVALAATLVPSLLCFAGTIELDTVKTSALVGTLVWFAATPLWMGRDSSDIHEEVFP